MRYSVEIRRTYDAARSVWLLEMRGETPGLNPDVIVEEFEHADLQYAEAFLARCFEATANAQARR